MNNLSIISIADILNSILLLATIIGVFLAYRQIKEGRKTQRATFFKDLYLTLYGDTDIGNAYYQIEYGEFLYDENFHGSPDEKSIDHLLNFANLVCRLYHQKVITEQEMSVFHYRFLRIYQDPHVQNYLEFLTSFSFNQVGVRRLQDFVSYCEKELEVKKTKKTPKTISQSQESF
jgi:hypothetical protein